MSKLRRAERQMSLSASWDFIKNSEVIRVGVNAENRPYIIPLNYVVVDDNIYFHSAKEGRKVALFIDGLEVTAELDKLIKIKEEPKGCSYSCYYQSVMIEGIITRVDELDKKVEVLNKLVKKYATQDFIEVTKPDSQRVFVYKIEVIKIIGKELLPN
jgi:nitroimidazol reductase NimA-like FMN-containing flavoprotein (pyridoxamine 5'-phosphate oxidase superfamily)